MVPANELVEDVFISYGHIDNRSGWVTALHDRLQIRISELLGREARVWRDPKINGADSLWELIGDRISHSSVFVSIFSPRYVSSDACRQEAEQFRAVTRSTGLKVDLSFRII